MTYSVDNITPVSFVLTAAGLAPANFSTAMAYATQADLASGVTFADGTVKDYTTTSEVIEDFEETSAPYLIAARWFAQVPKPPSISIYMWDDDISTGETPLQAIAAADALAWRYWHFFPNSVASTASDVYALADWADSNKHFVAFTDTNADAKDSGMTNDLGSLLTARGNRHIFLGYRDAATVSGDAAQGYAHVQTAAAFQKFNPDGIRTAITAEYQVLPGVTGESLASSAYTSLKSKNYVFWTQVELQGSIDASRVINSKTPSSFGEYIDDVVNIDVLGNRMQVAQYDYITNPGAKGKNALTVKDFAGMLNAVEGVLKQFYNNGVLGEGNYTDPVTGETKLAKFGYVILTEPEAVLSLTTAQRKARQYPPIQVLAVLARAGHTVQTTLYVE